MKKLESTLPNMVLSLLLICSIMAGALALVYGATKDPIAQADIKVVNEAVKEVVPAYDNDPNADQWEADGLVFYPAKMNGELVGTAVKTFTDKGFSGHFEIMVGFLPDGTIYNSKVLSHKETPGLGSKMSDPKFHDQFNNMKPQGNLSVKKDGGTIDAITAATISSRAYCDAINRAQAALGSNEYDSTSGATKGGQE
jgi:electron transport complex protein RnfG